MLNRIAAYTLFVLGVVTLTFFRHYTSTLIPYPWIFLLLGLGMFLAGYLLLRYPLTSKDKTTANKVRHMIDDLKANGEKIRVDFKDCHSRGHEYSEAVENPESYLVGLTGSGALTAVMNHLENPTGMRDIRQSVIIFQQANSRTGTTEKFLSPVIAKDEVSLSFYLDQQQRTTLYVDKSNRNLYYFDLDFLNA
jgi:hypothetical protein